MSARTATYAARRTARRQIFGNYADQCRVERPDPDGTGGDMDPGTGQYPDPEMLLIYEGPFHYQVRSDINANAVEAVIGEHEDTYRTATAQFPIDTPAKAKGSTAAIRDNDQLTFLVCRTDPSMAGRKMNLQADVKGKSNATMRRFRSREPLS